LFDRPLNYDPALFRAAILGLSRPIARAMNRVCRLFM
jgi:hypothetical protein